MLMSDSIGGTAKTLMFVNVSPVDANLDETQNSLQVWRGGAGRGARVQSWLGVGGWEPSGGKVAAAARLTSSPACASPAPAAPQYAQRVSTIRNDVSKHENSVEVLKLKKQVGRAGGWGAALLLGALLGGRGQLAGG